MTALRPSVAAFPGNDRKKGLMEKGRRDSTNRNVRNWNLGQMRSWHKIGIIQITVLEFELANNNSDRVEGLGNW